MLPTRSRNVGSNPSKGGGPDALRLRGAVSFSRCYTTQFKNNAQALLPGDGAGLSNRIY